MLMRRRILMRPSIRSSLVLVALLSTAAACGGATPPPTMAGKEGMLSESAIAQKCGEAAKGHDKPFVIQWDATDLASFEAKAKKGTVVVRYEGCKLEVLETCTRNEAGGALGEYANPEFTTGGEQGLDVKNQGELYAKLPLGAASFSGRVTAGENLHLKYFVAGVVSSHSTEVFKGDLARAKGCASATHFVSSYNLGAFELDVAEKNSVEAEGSSVMGASAGGKRSHEQSSVARGGDVAKCRETDNRSCRVPIRLVLRSLSEGTSAASAQLGPDGKPVSAVTAGVLAQVKGTEASTDEIVRLSQQVNDRFNRGDGAGCVQAYDEWVRAGGKFGLTPKTRAWCTMMAGKCDDGSRELRQYLASEDTNHTRRDEDLDREVRQDANRRCPYDQTKSEADALIRIRRDIGVASQAKNTARCKELFDAAEKRMTNVTNDRDGGASEGRSALDSGYRCIAANTTRCSELRPIFVRWKVSEVAFRKDPKATERNRKDAERDFDRDETRRSKCTP
jgi:hypothetical protein